MNVTSQKFRKPIELLGAICGGLLISIPAIPEAVVAQQLTSKVNPCPGIFYEEPYNNLAVMPQGCPPNALTQRLVAQGLLPSIQSGEQTGQGIGGETPGRTASSVLNPNPSIFNQPPYNRSQGTLQPEGSMTPSPAPSEQSPSPTPGMTSRTQPPQPSQRQAPTATIALANGRVSVKLVNDTAANVTYQVIGATPPRSLPGNSDVTLQGLIAPVTVTFQRDDRGFLTVTPQPSPQTGMLEVTFKETADVGQDRSAMRIESNGSVFLN
jgi:hypothetical protein